MKTKLCILLLFTLLNIHSNSQTPNWGWATNALGATTDKANDIATCASGNVYVTGYFRSPTIAFGSDTLLNANVSGNKGDMFVVKYNSTGTVLWAARAGGNNEDGGYAVAIDASENVYVTGYFASSTITFGSFTLSNSGLYSMFIVKYNSTGTVLWAKSAGGTVGDDYGRSITLDASNNLYITGSFQSPTIPFGSFTLTNTDITGSTNDMFIVKYDSAGTVILAKSAGGSASENARSVSIDTSGNFYVVGNFNSPTLIFGTTTLTNAGSYDMYLVKYDTTGTVLWAKSAGGTGGDLGNSTSTDRSGNIYISGGFASPSLTFGSTILNNAGAYNMYITKYNPSGIVLWAKKEGGTGTDDGSDVVTDTYGNAYLTGYFTSPSLTLGSTTFTNLGGNDIFVVKYDSAGIVSWAKNSGDIGDDYGISVASNDSNLYIAGYFGSPTINFATTTLYNDDADYDAFVAKISNIETSSGITEINAKDDISIYTNPTNGIFNVVISSPAKNATIEIYNSIGALVYNKQTENTQTTIELTNQAKGLYFVKVMSENKIIGTQKIIKE